MSIQPLWSWPFLFTLCWTIHTCWDCNNRETFLWKTTTFYIVGFSTLVSPDVPSFNFHHSLAAGLNTAGTGKDVRLVKVDVKLSCFLYQFIKAFSKLLFLKQKDNNSEAASIQIHSKYMEISIWYTCHCTEFVFFCLLQMSKRSWLISSDIDGLELRIFSNNL